MTEATVQAYARIFFPVFQDKELNGRIKSAILSPLKVKYDFKNALAAEHPALSNMDAVSGAAAGYLGENSAQAKLAIFSVPRRTSL